jgi:predicted cobalt transporter CbtA
MMKALHRGSIFGLSILAGMIAGGILVGLNVVLVQPYTKVLADIEIEDLLVEGEFDEDEFDLQLQSIYFSQLYCSIAVGLAGGALVGTGAYVLDGMKSSPVKAALMVAGIEWFVLYFVPMVKYPPSPEALFASGAAGTYQSLLAGYVAISGLAALGIAIGFKKIKRGERTFGASALYLVIVAAAFFAFPNYESEKDSLLPRPLINAWRSAIAMSMTVFWFSLGIIAGMLWLYGRKSIGKAI